MKCSLNSGNVISIKNSCSKDFQKYRKDCKQCLCNNRENWRNIDSEKAKSFTRENFQQNKRANIEKSKIKLQTNPNSRTIHNLGRRIY